MSGDATAGFAPRVVLGGPPRSGSTLARYIIGSLPGIVSCPETNLLIRSHAELLRKRKAVAKRLAEKLELPPETIDACLDGADTSVGVVDRLMRSYAERVGIAAHGWCEKTPRNCHVYSRIAGEADCCFISLVRDGRDVVTSVLAGGDGYHCPVERYVAAMQDVYAFRHPRHMILSYEELVREPQQVLRRICAHIGEPYDEGALERYRLPHPSRDPSKVRQPKVGRPISDRWIGRWRRPEHRARVAELLADRRAVAVLRRSGYLDPDG